MRIIEWLLKHLLALVISSVLYIISFHFDFFNLTNVYYYDGIVRLIVVALISLALEIVFSKKLHFEVKDYIVSVSWLLLANMLFLSLCIVSLDRSLSVFLLCYMSECQDGLTDEEVNQTFQDVFIDRYEMLGRRFDEQVVTGNIQTKDGKYILTDRGRMFVNIFRVVGEAYNVDKRFIYPEIVQ